MAVAVTNISSPDIDAFRSHPDLPVAVGDVIELFRVEHGMMTLIHYLTILGPERFELRPKWEGTIMYGFEERSSHTSVADARLYATQCY